MAAPNKIIDNSFSSIHSLYSGRTSRRRKNSCALESSFIDVGVRATQFTYGQAKSALQLSVYRACSCVRPRLCLKFAVRIHESKRQFLQTGVTIKILQYRVHIDTLFSSDNSKLFNTEYKLLITARGYIDTKPMHDAQKLRHIKFAKTREMTHTRTL